MEQERRPQGDFIRADQIVAEVTGRIVSDLSQSPSELALHDIAGSPSLDVSAEIAAQAQVINNRNNGTPILNKLIGRHGVSMFLFAHRPIRRLTRRSGSGSGSDGL